MLKRRIAAVIAAAVMSLSGYAVSASADTAAIAAQTGYVTLAAEAGSMARASAQVVSSDYTSVVIRYGAAEGAVSYKVTDTKNGGVVLATFGADSAGKDQRIGGFLPNRGTYLLIQAVKADGSTEDVGFVYAEPKHLGAPANIKILDRTSDTTEYTTSGVSWNAVDGAQGYCVYQKIDGKEYYSQKTTKVQETLYSLKAGSDFEFVVKPYIEINGVLHFGDSSASSVVRCRPQTPTVTASASGTSIKITYDRTAGAEGYMIYRSTSKDGEYTRIAAVSGADKTSYTDKGLKSGTTYYYKVRAYRTVDGTKSYSEYSAVKSAKTAAAASTPVDINGKLKVSGANIVNQYGEKFQIRGMSTHGLMWEDFSDITTTASLKVLRDDWGVNTIRLAMYTEEWGGYTTGSNYAAQAKQKVITGVDNATSLGMYAIIDWHILHDGNPQSHQSEAVSFFTEMAKKYKNNNNVIYEICNEPNGGVTWSSNIKPYATAVVNAIRKQDPDAIIVVGTGTWSQDVDQVLGNKLSDKNVVYTLHFYANTHTDWLRNRFTSCYNSGLPMLVTEFGTCDASGNGGYNAAQTKEWLRLLDSKMVGYVNWSACGKNETASAFKSGTNLKAISKGTSQLTESGKLVRSWYRDRAGLK